MDTDRRIADLEAVPEESTLLVTLSPRDPATVEETDGDVGTATDGTLEAEAVVIRLDEGVSAFRRSSTTRCISRTTSTSSFGSAPRLETETATARGSTSPGVNGDTP